MLLLRESSLELLEQMAVPHRKVRVPLQLVVAEL